MIRPFALACMLGFVLVSSIVWAEGAARLEIDTSKWSGRRAILSIEYVSADTAKDTLEVLDFVSDGLRTAAPVTLVPWEIEQMPDSSFVPGERIHSRDHLELEPLANDEIEQRILVPFDSLGHMISFGLRATENRTRGCLIPDLVAVRLVNERDSSLVQTSDPLGTGALLTLEMNSQPGRRLRVFPPARVRKNGVVFVALSRR